MKYLEQHFLLRTPVSGSIHLTDSLRKKTNRQLNLPYYPRILPELIKKILNQSISELPYFILLYKSLNKILSTQEIHLSGIFFCTPDSLCAFVIQVCFSLMNLLGQIFQQKTPCEIQHHHLLHKRTHHSCKHRKSLNYMRSHDGASAMHSFFKTDIH